MPFGRPTLLEIKDRIESDLNTEVENPTTFLRRSVFKILAKVLGGAIYLLYDFLDYVKDQMFITTADAEILQIHGSEYGVAKNFGTKATGSGAATGTTGSIISAGSQLQSASGNKYNVTTGGTLAAGAATITFQADLAGNDYNEAAGTVLSFISPPTGVNTAVTVITGGITGGVTEETNDAYRARILTRKRQPPHGGDEQDYINWALEYSSTITRAWAISEYQGIGTVGVTFVQDNETSIFPSSTTRDAVEAYIISHTDSITGKNVGIPVTAEAGFFLITPTPLEMGFTIQIYPNTTAIQATVTAKIEDLLLDQGGPEQTIYLSKIYKAVSLATGEDRCAIVLPAGDTTAASNEVHTLGTITWQNYNG